MLTNEPHRFGLLRTLTDAFLTFKRVGPHAVMDNIDLLVAHLDVANQKVAELETKYRELSDHAAELERKLTARRLTNGQTEYFNARFEPDGRGGYKNQPICPLCLHVMRSDRGGKDYFKCTKCGEEAYFSGADLPEVISELPAPSSSAG
ncbi:MAG TPA: hypothetical protein VJU83_09475 [Burkholderiales bacterium]|nr:hypothetical protein [Burkholderiales bacterium]